MEVYQGVMDLIKEHTPNLSKSLAQFLLVERGLQHTQNPEPLIKEVEKKVYVDRPVEKVVYRDRPKVIDAPKETQKVHDEIIREMDKKDRTKTEHLTDRIVDIPKPKEKKEDPKEEESSSDGSNVGKWVGGTLLVGVVGYCLYKMFTV
jgi:hypothetical protein